MSKSQLNKLWLQQIFLKSLNELMYLWCNCIWSIIRGKSWSIVHQTFSIIWYTKCKWFFLFDKIPALPCQNLIPIYSNIFVSIRSGLLMVKPKGMDKFMSDGLFWIAIISTSVRRCTQKKLVNKSRSKPKIPLLVFTCKFFNQPWRGSTLSKASRPKHQPTFQQTGTI